MSRLVDLIAEFCPDGVPYKRFDEVCSLNARIGWQRLTKAEYRDQGDFLLVTGTDFTEDHRINYESCVYVDEERYIQDSKIQLRNEDILITKDGTLGKVAQVHNLPKPATLNGGVFVVRCVDGTLENRFILHYLLSSHFTKVVNQQKTGSTISHLTQGLFSRLTIPVPPLGVQKEIVRILDAFSSLSMDLSKALSDELLARKKQYDYYCKELLSFGNEAMTVSVGDVCNVIVGGEVPEDSIKGGEPDENHPYPIWGNGKEVYGYASGHVVSEDAVCISSIGANTGKVFYHEGNFTPIIRLKVVIPKVDGINRRFLFHAMSQVDFQPKKSSVPNMSANDIKKAKIVLPGLADQIRIANVLDNFEKQFDEMKETIPEEMEAREEQYAYYRDMLLSFKEI